MSARTLLFAAGAAALAACAFGAATAWPAFLRSWLVAVLTWGALPVGAVAALMAHGLTGGAWGRSSRHVWLALAAASPLFAFALLPLLFGLDELFPWTAPPDQLSAVVRRKLGYLNETFFTVRSLVYIAIWLALPWLLGVWGRHPAGAVHAPGLIVWALTVSFFGVDWLMSLEPAFYSDVFGLMLMTGTATVALAAGLLLVARSAEPAIRLDLANLWLAVLLGWAFMTFAQLIIIWSGNLPDEIEWYAARRNPPWAGIGWAALVLFAVLPFAILLSTAAKRRASWLTAATTSCLAGHVLYVHWLVLPAFERQIPAQIWLDPAALLAVGAGVVFSIDRRLGAARSWQDA